MEEISRLNEAFNNFTVASKSLETYYERLHEKVRYLTIELEEKNRQLKDALSDAEEAKDYLNGILQNLREAIIVVDLDENVAMMNRASEEMLGLVAEYTIGNPFDSLDFSIESEGSDTILVTENKKYNVILSYSKVLDSRGLVRGHVLLLQDITRIKELEAQQERNHRLIAMGEMAAKIVHEIRSPLCSIELYAGMLAKDLEGTRHIDLAKGISTGIRSLNNILTNMLYFARPQKPLFKVVDIGKSLDESVSMLVPLLEAKSITLMRNGADTGQISGDSELLKQVFLNILLNAIHATPEEEKIEVGIKMDNGCAVVEIKDYGDGISHENHEKIFDPFFSTKDKGTGLGLTIASKIMQAHRGAIKVNSELGKGSCFQLYFPLERKI